MSTQFNFKGVMSDASKSSRATLGDWQTSYEFAITVCEYLKDQNIFPEILIEPTCGVGNFISAAIDVFGSIKKVIGIDICKDYIETTERRLKDFVERGKIESYELFNINFFHFDFDDIISVHHNQNILVLGNPPWVTNSEQGKNDSDNLPKKVNIKGVRGIDAITGKGNFDIAENICYRIMEAFSCERNTHIALLVKNSVIKNIIHHQRRNPHDISEIKQISFDAKKEFNVSVAASLLLCRIATSPDLVCEVFDMYSRKRSHSYGWVDNAFTANTEEYNETIRLDGVSQLMWRSGIKHDCSKVMELTLVNGQYINGFNEVVDIEPESIFPLLKSSDIGKGYKGIRKYIVLPQKNINEDTSTLRSFRPRTYSYLLKHAILLDKRKSIIYRNKPRFCVFGLGDYSFLPYKIVISSLYKDIHFSLVGPINGCPVMVDDTCYLLGFDNLSYAQTTLRLLQSEIIKKFLRNICFEDSKRIICRDSLMRINLYQLALNISDIYINEIPKEDYENYKTWLAGNVIPTLF